MCSRRRLRGGGGRPLVATLENGGMDRRALTLIELLAAIAIVAVYVGLVVANFVWLWPILVSDPITNAELTARMWLPSWG